MEVGAEQPPDLQVGLPELSTCVSVSRLGREQHGLGGQRLHDGRRGRTEQPRRLRRLRPRRLGDRGAEGESAFLLSDQTLTSVSLCEGRNTH